MEQSDILYDAIIIGGGPAGSTAAYILSKQGFRVLLADRKIFPRPKLCAGLITRKTTGIIEDIYGENVNDLKTQRIICHQTRDWAIHSRSRELARGRLDIPFSYVNRTMYDNFFLKKAKKAGTQVIEGERVVSVDIVKTCVKTEKGRIFSGRFIIGAEGAASMTRRVLAQSSKITENSRKGLAIAVEIAIDRHPPHYFPGHPLLYFGYIPWGYAWSFPSGDKQVIGMGGLIHKSGCDIKARFYTFLSSLPYVKDPKKIQIKGHLLPYGNFLRQPGFKNILLAGDACGFADPLLGEGIYYAHKSGQLAARSIIASLKSPEQAVSVYKKSLKKPVYIELEHAKRCRWLLFSFLHHFDYRPFGVSMKIITKRIEETIQGLRSFRGMKKIEVWRT